MLQKPKIMGILNVTPDSFFDQGAYLAHDKAIQRGIDLATGGADILDIGGESTRPGAQPVSLEEEIYRVIPVIQALHKEVSIPLSVDTSKPEVARLAINAGATFINDVTGLQDPAMQKLANQTNVHVCVMHMQGVPQTMQKEPYYKNGIISELTAWFVAKLDLLQKVGIPAEKIYLDPGIGFGKNVADNLKILQNLSEFKRFGCPLLLGVSRKTFMGKIVNKSAKDLLPTTLAANVIGIRAGVDMIRVHDVPEHRDVIDFLFGLHTLA